MKPNPEQTMTKVLPWGRNPIQFEGTLLFELSTRSVDDSWAHGRAIVARVYITSEGSHVAVIKYQTIWEHEYPKCQISCFCGSDCDLDGSKETLAGILRDIDPVDLTTMDAVPSWRPKHEYATRKYIQEKEHVESLWTEIAGRIQDALGYVEILN